jgi:O-acetylhomoserine/O-acetylserine sulfhydrylase-like pyridoxal-dependent enzyme
MSEKKPFFMRDQWAYDPDKETPQLSDAHLGFDTRALHAGFNPHESTKDFRSFVPPIVQSMTYPYETFDKIPCPVYGRTKTPTNSVLESRLASLEGGEACITSASGSQALFNLIFTMARPGDNVLTSLNVFGEGYKHSMP